MTRRSLVAVGAFLAASGAYAAWTASSAAIPVPPHRASAPLDLSELPVARIAVDSQRQEITIELPAVDLPAGAGHDAAQPPASLGEVPVSGAMYGFRAEAVDETGRLLPAAVIHHFNVMNPVERELFLPIARRLLAAGQETGVVRLPWLLFGAPIRAGERVLVNAMLHNPTPVSYRGVRVRMIVNYVPEHRPWPLFTAFPWQLDVGFPVGDKSFDLPPGRSERTYEGSPAVAGDLVVIGGHLHEYGVMIELWDATTGELIWHGEPASTANGTVGAVPIGKLYGVTRRGAHITPDHRYRVRAVYENPTGQVVQAGGMGVVAGLFIPDRGAVWPSADTTDSLFQQDLRHFLGQDRRLTVSHGPAPAGPAAAHSHSSH